MPPATKTTLIALSAAAALLLGLPAAWMLFIARSTVEVEAVIVEQKRNETSTSQQCHPTVRYELDGQTYQHYFTGSQPCSEVGARMTVLVDPDDPDEPYGEQSTQLFPIIAMTLGAALAFFAVRTYLRYRKAGPFVATVATLAPRPTRWWIQGTASGEAELRAPLGGEPCMAWTMILIALPKNERHEFAFSDIRPFSLEDSSGTVRVDADAETSLTLEKRSPLHNSREVDPLLEAFLRERGLERFLGRAVDWHWRIETLEPGQRVQVVGNYHERDHQGHLGPSETWALQVSNTAAPIA